MAVPNNNAVPYLGAGPEPQSVPFESPSGAAPQTAVPAETQGSYAAMSPFGGAADPTAPTDLDMAALTAGPVVEAPPQVVSAPPPAAPADAAKLSQLEQRIGELTNALGDYKKMAEEARLERDIERAIAQSVQRPAVPPLELPDGVDPNHSLTIKDFHNLYFGQLLPQQQATTQAQVIRAALNVTPEEEAAAQARFPSLPTHEPARSIALQRILPVMRAPAPAPTPVAAAPTATPAPTRPLAPTVPTVEVSAPSVGSAQPEDQVQRALAMYKQAQQIPDPQKRIDALRAARIAWERATGVTQDYLKTTGFKQIG